VCTILFAWNWRDDTPLVLVANRDERIGRATDPPMLLHEDPAVWGGRDRVAGGTWLAVDPANRRVCALTNRHAGEADTPRDDSLRSRGELPVLWLTRGDVAMGHLDAANYNPVNVLCFSPERARFSTLASSTDLLPGVHALTVQDVDDPTSAKTSRLVAKARAAADVATTAEDLRDRLAALLTSHDTEPGEPPQAAACIHGDDYGTVSSSTVVVGQSGVELRYAGGRPCVTPYAAVDLSRKQK
jgi:uncharacterized protein with NRDE domain